MTNTNPNMALRREIVNASQRGEPYKPPVMQSPRPAADDHLKCKSVGVLAGKVAA